jgi:ketosteroid isomerase-like protein
MSQENVALIRAGYEAVNTRDIAGWLAGYHVDAELHEVPSVPDADVYRGHSGLKAWLESILEVGGDEFGFEMEEVTDAGEFTIVRVRAYGRGVLGGVPVEMRAFHVFEIDGGKIRRVWGYLDESEALEAVGLRE